ncbi:Aerobic cobaltochelatase subunit CobT [Candidatus Hodgkinia cicadicola]|nr:Aerobic cobaltochelatase subunit CobT [Candidatus Hodgkinia cicadicola]
MLAQLLSIKLACVLIQANFIDNSCANALCKACWIVLKFVVLKSLVQGLVPVILKQQTLKQFSTLYTMYTTYTKRFDKTLTLSQSKYNCINNTKSATLGFIEVINQKRICQIAIDATQVIEKISPSNPEKSASTLNFIIDKSASMLDKQKKVTELVKAIIRKTKLNYELNCYTTRHWHNSNSYKLWLQTGRRRPGRVNDILYLECGSSLSALTRLDIPNKENVDGEAVVALTKTTHINIIINDNEPADYNTCLLNSQDILVEHWKTTFLSACTQKRKIIVLNLGRNKLKTTNCINLNEHLTKQKFTKIINTILKLNAA